MILKIKNCTSYKTKSRSNVIRAFKFIIYLAFLFFITSLAYADTRLTKSFITSEIDKMCGQKYNGYKIIDISKPIKGLTIVSIRPPYREFPNQIIFKFDSEVKKWVRVYEALCIGIEDNPSDILDLHTTDDVIDVIIGDNMLFGEKFKKITKIANAKNMIFIPYTHFQHMHGFEDVQSYYTIDKTKFLEFAVLLKGDKYTERYRTDTCMMYDMPNITNTRFYYEDNTYIIVTETDNRQRWMILFKGIDEKFEYILDKKIIVERF